VVTLLVDANLDGHANLLAMRLATSTWSELRDYFDIRFLHLEQTGLEREAKDRDVWRFCQEKGYYLLTANRNLNSEDSLEATIRREANADSLPVFTLANADRVLQSTSYVDQVIESLLERLLNADNLKGSGRIYLP
jgi:hypothetical protein